MLLLAPQCLFFLISVFFNLSLSVFQFIPQCFLICPSVFWQKGVNGVGLCWAKVLPYP